MKLSTFEDSERGFRCPSLATCWFSKPRNELNVLSSTKIIVISFQDTNKLEYLIPKKSSLRHRLPMGDQGFIDFVAHLLEVNPKKRPTASKALKHPWLSFPYEPISSWYIYQFWWSWDVESDGVLQTFCLILFLGSVLLGAWPCQTRKSSNSTLDSWFVH